MYDGPIIEQSDSCCDICNVTELLLCCSVGELLSVIDTRQMNNTHGAVSPCGRFVASSGK